MSSQSCIRSKVTHENEVKGEMMKLNSLLFTGLMIISAAASATPFENPEFSCIRDMTPVRGFYVDNLLGDLEATKAVAESETGGTYPPGSVIQLVPTEVMVKREEGHSPATNDWEFFELSVSTEGSEITTRGFSDVVNRFGGNCLDCHEKAEPQWDMVCEKNHGCAPIPFTELMVKAIQKTDPRCEVVPLSEDEMAALQALSGGAGE